MKFKRAFFVLYVIVLYVVCTPFLPMTLFKHLENKYKPVSIEELADFDSLHIVTLGAGASQRTGFPAYMNLEAGTLTRLIEGVRLANALPKSAIITSGGSISGKKPQALYAKEAAADLGIAPARIFAMQSPLNTLQEAQNYVDSFGIEIPLVLVTSAYHMHRALFRFRQQGVTNVIPAPTHYFSKDTVPLRAIDFLPNPVYAKYLGMYIKEKIGFWLAKHGR